MAPKQQGLLEFFGGGSEKRRNDGKNNGHNVSSAKRVKAGGSRFGVCPLCNKNFPMHVLESHAEACNGSVEESPSTFAILKASAVPGDDDTSAGNSGEPPVAAHYAAHDSRSIDDVARERPSTTSANGKPTNVNKDLPWWKCTNTSQNRQRIENPILLTCEPIPGLFVFEDFITEEEEAMILAELDGESEAYRHEFLPWKLANFNGPHRGKRWGVHCNLRDRRVSAPEHPLPHFISELLRSKLHRVEPMMGCTPNEANAIDYCRRQGHYLQSHVDDRQLSKEPIANLSVAGDCYMTFRNEKKHVTSDPEVKRVLLKRRTLQVLTGRARYDFSHGIQNEDLLSDRRVSITMRESPLTKM